MATKILDGKTVAAVLRDELQQRVRQAEESGCSGGLALLLVGDDPAARIYAGSLEKNCVRIGVRADVHRLPADTPAEVLLALIQDLNDNPEIQGILPLFPMPAQIDPKKVAGAIRPEKDVECMNPVNVGHLLLGESAEAPGTPRAVMRLLAYYGVDLEGKHAVVIGRSNVVGKPLALLLLRQNATVTVCHSHTPDLGRITRGADVVVAAVGRPGLVTADMVRAGAVVVDVGINTVHGKVVGDVDFDAVSQVAGAITPVPGGVGAVSGLMILDAVLRRRTKLCK